MTMLLPNVLASSSGEWDGHWWPLWPLLWLAVLAGIVWLVSRRRWRPSRPSGGERARDLLAVRFARGEIDGEEYRARLEQLR